MKSFGAFIRALRTAKGMLLREVAASMQIDPSLLSRIECGTKRPARDHVALLATALSTDENELMVHFLSDRLVYELQGEAMAIQAMVAAEEKMRYLTGTGHSAKKIE